MIYKMVNYDLIKCCQQGHEDAFDELFRVYSTKAKRTAYLLAGRMGIAEDILQEAFLECFKDIHKLRKPELFEIWFHRLLVRICWRMAKKERKSASESLEDNLGDIIDDRIDTQTTVESKELNTMLRKAIDGLRPHLRTTIILYYYNDMSIKEVAQILNCFEGTVKSRLHNAKKILAKHLEKELPDQHFNLRGYSRKEWIVDES
ncbi:RNA polymerase sigma factor [Petroclostridium sp. X23]|uniref:RNA polymerase sigma factor n=1 Tax=Petroclostridium sp. X23 TaxID=3045146 RepID=UPI0024AC8FD5|nr:RNA polymerase sigma factor [Petroclostridium sp. X23]WHH57268.1 RNA polymerase sigma factor [Petroclostridium sp. X23]